MKLKRKIILSYLILSLLPISLFCFFSQHYIKDLLLDKELLVAEDSLKQVALQVESQLEVYNTISNYIFNNTKILSGVNAVYSAQYYKMYAFCEEEIQPTFLTFYALHPDLNRITIYTESDLEPYSTSIAPLKDIQHTPWVSKVEANYTPVWLVSQADTNGNKALVLARKMINTAQYSLCNYLYLSINYQDFFAPFRSVSSEEYGIAVLDQHQQVLFTYHTVPDTLALDFSSTPIDTMRATKQEEYLFLTAPLHEEQWTLVFYRPMAQVMGSVSSIMRILFVALCGVLVILGLLAFLFTHVIVSPIEALTKNMKQVQKGDLTVTITATSTDEVGIMIHSFSEMIARIKRLIQEVYQSGLEKKEYELRLLQSQMNPHFLYNSLSLINSKAILTGQKEISRMSQLLSTFYRSALNQGNEITTIENEFTNIKSYIEMQKILGGESLQVAYCVDPQILDRKMPNFILQPLVENAIGHGLQNSTKPKKRLILTISCVQEHTAIYIEDNGIGMAPPLPTSGKGYGLQNIEQRLALIYGSNYTFQIESAPNRGTCVTLLLPSEPPPPAPQAFDFKA